ncbi:MAG: glycosyltransferase family 4 protein, partial [Planctomycetota bacterium]
RRIVYGVPIASESEIESKLDAASDALARDQDDRPAPPLRLAYVGRVVQWQKRIFDFVDLVRDLEERGVKAVLHIIGDGSELAELRRRFDQLATELTQPRFVEVQIHGRLTPDEVQRLLHHEIDVSLLLSEFEGTSITMLESMGAGVVPAVTAVDSGVSEWVQHGQNGIVVPVGRPDLMADQLAELSRDRPMLHRFARAAWQTVKDQRSIAQMTNEWVELFDAVMQQPDPPVEPTDRGLRVFDRWRWQKAFSDDPIAAEAAIKQTLTEAGYQKIAFDRHEPGADALIVREGIHMPTEAEVWALEQQGVGVVFSPHLIVLTEFGPIQQVRQKMLQARQDGRGRIAIYGVGKHSKRSLPGFSERIDSILCFIDDAAPASADWMPLEPAAVSAGAGAGGSSQSSSSPVAMFPVDTTGATTTSSAEPASETVDREVIAAAAPLTFCDRPVLRLEDAMSLLHPETIILSSDAWEAEMWARTRPWRERGEVHVECMYGTYDD